ncbi:MAG: tetratricopeptide repeat protein, partial [Candidatus Acidoferrales bacterium]
GDSEGALELYEKSLGISERLGDLAGMSRSYGQMGIVKQDRGDSEGALELYEKSLGISERLGDLEVMSRSYRQMGIVKQHRGDSEGALELYEKSLGIKERLGDLAGMSKSLMAQGLVLLALHQVDKASKALRKGARLYDQMGLPLPQQLRDLLRKLEASKE